MDPPPEKRAKLGEVWGQVVWFVPDGLLQQCCRSAWKRSMACSR